MPKKVYPLQQAINDALIESASILANIPFDDGSGLSEVANKYFKAITRINDICVDRKRY